MHLRNIYWFTCKTESLDFLVVAHSVHEAKKYLATALEKDESSPDMEDIELFRYFPNPQYGDVIPF